MYIYNVRNKIERPWHDGSVSKSSPCKHQDPICVLVCSNAPFPIWIPVCDVGGQEWPCIHLGDLEEVPSFELAQIWLLCSCGELGNRWELFLSLLSVDLS